MKKANYIFRTAACVAVLMFGSFSCAEEFTEPETASGETILDVVKASTDFDILEAALIKTGLSISLGNANSGSYTVFAPTDAAFLTFLQSSAAYNNGTLTEAQAILNIQNLTNSSTPFTIAQLAARLNYHVISSEIDAEDVTLANGFNTLNGARLSLSKPAATVLINANINSITATGNGASVTSSNADPVNGVIHVIDRMLNPFAAATSVLGSLGYTHTTTVTPINYTTNPTTINGGNTPDGTDTDYDLFAIALRKTGLYATVYANATPIPDFTVFAPRDLPFRTYLATLSGTVTNETTAQTFINSLDGTTTPTLTEFTNLIKYHIVTGRVLSTDLTNAQAVTTLLTGKTFTPTIGGTITLADQNGTSPDATIVSSNNLTNAGVLHGIDNVLIPN